MISQFSPEPLRGDALRSAIREIAGRSMLPVYDQPAVQTDPRAARKPEREGTPRQGVGKKISEANLASRARRIASLRPPGHLTRDEVVTQSGYGLRRFVKLCARNSIKSVMISGVAFYDGAALRAAGIMASMMLALLPGIAAAHDWYPRECCSGKDCKPVSECMLPNGAMGLVYAEGTCTPIDWSKMKGISPDGGWHACLAISIEPPGLQPRCIFGGGQS